MKQTKTLDQKLKDIDKIVEELKLRKVPVYKSYKQLKQVISDIKTNHWKELEKKNKLELIAVHGIIKTIAPIVSLYGKMEKKQYEKFQKEHKKQSKNIIII